MSVLIFLPDQFSTFAYFVLHSWIIYCYCLIHFHVDTKLVVLVMSCYFGEDFYWSLMQLVISLIRTLANLFLLFLTLTLFYFERICLLNSCMFLWSISQIFTVICSYTFPLSLWQWCTGYCDNYPNHWQWIY